MSTKTTPHNPPGKNGDCIGCHGSGHTGMYQDRCNDCDGTGYAKRSERQEPLKCTHCATEYYRTYTGLAKHMAAKHPDQPPTNQQEPTR